MTKTTIDQCLPQTQTQTGKKEKNASNLGEEHRTGTSKIGMDRNIELGEIDGQQENEHTTQPQHYRKKVSEKQAYVQRQSGQVRGNEPHVEADDEIGQREGEKKTKQSLLGCLNFALRLWSRIIYQTIPILVPLVLFMWIYYLPAVLLMPKMLDEVKVLLYEYVSGYLSVFFYYYSMSHVASELFSFQYSKNAIVCVIFPCFLADAILHSIPQRNYWIINLAENIAAFLAPSLSLYVINRSKACAQLNKEQEIFFELTKDGTPFAVLKCLFGLFFFIGIFIQYFVPILIKLSYLQQFLLRLFVFPLVFFSVKSYQTLIISGLSQGQMDKRLVINRATFLYVKFIGRIAVSNISTGSTTQQYLLLNFLVSSVDFFTTITFKERTTQFFRAKDFVSSLFSRIQNTKKTVPVVPGEINENENQKRFDEIVLKEHLEKSLYIRSLTFHEEISYETIVAVVAPLLMYFVHPLYPDTTFKTISSVKECFFQIWTQLFFVIVGDIASLTYEINKGTVKYQEGGNRVEVRNKMLATLLFIYYAAYLHNFLIKT